jgi:hypothetical protein
MNLLRTTTIAAVIGSFLLPLVSFAQAATDMAMGEEAMTPGDLALEPYLLAGKWISLTLFLVAAVIFIVAVRKYGKSTLGTVLTYVAMGSVLLLFSKGFDVVGGQMFNISDDSVMIWWHLLFYIAFGFYLFGIKALASLQEPGTDFEKVGKHVWWWGLLAALAVIYVYTIPTTGEPYVLAYLGTPLSSFGLHHFIAFAFAGGVAYYLFAVRTKLGMIGKALSVPMIIAIIMLSLQHLWELLNESWKVIVVTGTVGETVEQGLLIVASASLVYGASKLLKTGAA